VIGLALGLIMATFLGKKFKGMTVAEATAYSFDVLRTVIEYLIKLVSKLINLVTSSRNKSLPSE